MFLINNLLLQFRKDTEDAARARKYECFFTEQERRGGGQEAALVCQQAHAPTNGHTRRGAVPSRGVKLFANLDVSTCTLLQQKTDGMSLKQKFKMMNQPSLDYLCLSLCRVIAKKCVFALHHPYATQEVGSRRRVVRQIKNKILQLAGGSETQSIRGTIVARKSTPRKSEGVEEIAHPLRSLSDPCATTKFFSPSGRFIAQGRVPFLRPVPFICASLTGSKYRKLILDRHCG